jgi:uncharacterized membrane protein YbhN (UPF0104 family)
MTRPNTKRTPPHPTPPHTTVGRPNAKQSVGNRAVSAHAGTTETTLRLRSPLKQAHQASVQAAAQVQAPALPSEQRSTTPPVVTQSLAVPATAEPKAAQPVATRPTPDPVVVTAPVPARPTLARLVRQCSAALRSAWPWLRVLVGVAILAVLVWRLGTGAFLAGLRVVSGPTIAAALGIGLLTTVVSALRWCLVARRLGLSLSLRTAVADYYRATFLNCVLPMGVLGDVQRAVGHGRSSGDVGRGVRAVVLERTGGQIVLFVLCVVVLLVRPSVASTALRDIATGPAGVIVLAVVGVLVAVLLWGRRTARWRRAVSTAVTDARQGLLSRDTLPAVVVLSAVVLAGHITLFLVAARAAGSTAPVGRLLPLVVLALLASGLPVNIGGWGPRESATALAFGAAGLGATQGLTVSVVYGVLTLVTCLPGAGVLVFRYTGWLRTGTGPKVQLEERVVTEEEAS